MLLAPLLLAFFSCRGNGVSLMVYNVENLFDDVRDGTEYREFDPQGGKWGTDLFQARIDAVAEVIRRAVPGGPDIIVLQEIENENALRTLADRGLRGLGYTRAILVPQKGQAANPAVLTRLPVSRVRSLWMEDRTAAGGRDILEIEITQGDAVLHLFNCHWKSKTDGAMETEGARMAAARVLTDRLREILRQDPAADVVVAGDLNESMDERSRAAGRYRTALMPYGEAGGGAADGALFLAASPGELAGGADPLGLYEPWNETAADGRGSYFLDGRWETPDHVLLSAGLFDSRGYSYRRGSFKAYREQFLLQANGAPKGWRASSKGAAAGGYSDHLPLLAVFDVTE